MVHGLALKLRLELDALARRHNTMPPRPHVEPALPTCDDPTVLLSGWAATFDVDSERLKFLPGALTWTRPELRWRHQPGPIGTIEVIKEDARGIYVMAQTGHHLGKNGSAWSIAATVHAYELRDVDDPNNFHAAITKAHIDECSLTPTPANFRALVFERWPTCAAAERWRLLGMQAEIMLKLLGVIAGERARTT